MGWPAAGPEDSEEESSSAVEGEVLSLRAEDLALGRDGSVDLDFLLADLRKVTICGELSEAEESVMLALGLLEALVVAAEAGWSEM